MNLFRIRGIRLAIHASFLPLLACVAYEGWTAAAGMSHAAHWIEMGWSLAYVCLLFVCVTLHELGHCFMARRFGVTVPRILLLPIGGMAEFSSIPKRPRSEILIALAGPATNFLVASILMIFALHTTNWNPEDFPDHGVELLQHLVIMNIVMGCFNLLPVFPMDGGRILRALFATRLPYRKATRIAVRTGEVLSILGAFTMVFYFKNYLGGVLFAFVFMAGELEWRAFKQADRDECEWEDTPVMIHSMASEPTRHQ